MLSSELDETSRRKSVVTTASDSVLLDDWELFVDDAEHLRARLEMLRRSPVAELVVTANVDHALKLQVDPDFRAAYDSAALRTVDGAPLAWLAQGVAGQRVYRHTGADLLPAVCSWSKGASKILLLGGSDKVGKRAAAALRDRYDANVSHLSVGQISRLERTPELTASLRRIRPDYVFICLGAPKQELWFLENRSELPPAVFVGAGAAIDFAAGSATRAPLFVQRIGMEWAWRLAREPRRLFRRYLVEGPHFLGLIWRSAIHPTRRESVSRLMGDAA